MAVHRWMQRRCGRVVVRTLPNASFTVLRTSLLPIPGFLPARYRLALEPEWVILALNKLLPNRPDLVISGINRGGNLGENVFYSGTVGAAMEAAINHIPAIAVSVALLIRRFASWDSLLWLFWLP